MSTFTFGAYSGNNNMTYSDANSVFLRCGIATFTYVKDLV